MASQSGQGPAVCTLQYPEKYNAAVDFASSEEAPELAHEVQLVLYGLQRQATDGPCKDAKPWGWNVEESHKHQAWSGLGDMSQMEAMRLFVRTLEEHLPQWWQMYVEAGQQPSANGAASPDVQPQAAANGAAEPQQRSVAQAASAGSWTAPSVSGARCPPARYEHAAALSVGRMFVVGGNFGGRYLSDTWVLDLETMTWTPGPAPSRAGAAPPPSSSPENPPPPVPPAMPPTAGHVLLPWQNTLLSIGGHIKASSKAAQETEMLVRVLDISTMTWSVLTSAGDAPPARGGHSATLVGSRVWVFGGENRSRRPQGDVYVLDLKDMFWSKLETGGRSPTPRSAHVATAYADRWLLIFGGGSLVQCFDDLHVLDTHTGDWCAPRAEGALPSARAGHAGDLLGDRWYIVGGGNNTSGCADMLALDLRQLPDVIARSKASAENGISELDDEPDAPRLTWHHIVDVEPRSAIASEGGSLVAVPQANALVSFGGYNGKYHSDVHLFRPGEEVAQAAAVENDSAARQPLQQAVDSVRQPLQRLVEAALPTSSTSPTQASQQQAAAEAAAQQRASSAAQSLHSGASAASSDAVAQLRKQLEQAQQQAEASAAEAAAAKETAGHELALMRRQLSHTQSALTKAEQEAREAKEALSAEQGRSFKLEAQVAELRHSLSRSADMERELQRLRHALEEAETSKGRGGFLSYIVGTPRQE